MSRPNQPSRLDLELVHRGLAQSRARARDLILRGQVTVDGVSVTKPSTSIERDTVLQVSPEGRHVSRGALKLTAALNAFDYEVTGRTCLDVGASTGGFTEILLSNGAAKVYAVDVGHGQLAPSLREDPRVVNLEGHDARALASANLESVTAIVADVSFISLRKALPVPLTLATSGAWLVALIKPQFEVGRDNVGKGGIVRDEAVREQSVEDVRSWLSGQRGWVISGTIPSPITGGSGNVEYLLGARYNV